MHLRYNMHAPNFIILQYSYAANCKYDSINKTGPALKSRMEPDPKDITHGSW